MLVLLNFIGTRTQLLHDSTGVCEHYIGPVDPVGQPIGSLSAGRQGPC